MLVRPKDHLEYEFVKWVVVLTLASALALMVASVASGARPDTTPRTLPRTIQERSLPMGQYEEALEDMVKRPSVTNEKPATDFDLVVDLWMTIKQHREGNMEEAIAGWQQVWLLGDVELWRHVALGAAHLREGNVKEAVDALETAEVLDPANAVVHYYKALARLTQAAMAGDWYDAIGPVDTCLVSYTPDTTVPFPRSMYQFLAMMEFEAAIENAATVDPCQPFLPVSWAAPQPYRLAMPMVTPTVGDLLEAIGADNFEGKAHNMLGPLYLERGALEQAEEHMDAAVEWGMNVLDGYRELGDKYAESGRHADAFRAYLKATAHGSGVVGPAKKALESLRDAFIDIL